MSELSKRIITSVLLIIILILSTQYNLFLFLLLLFINFFTLIEFNSMFKKIFSSKFFQHFLYMILIAVYMITFSSIVWFLFVHEDTFYKISLFFLLLICISTDIGGFVFGKIIGGKKFKYISPNKTYSGVFGSFVFSIIFGLIFFEKFYQILDFDINVIIIILFISLTSQVGDLFISFLKRKAKIKDTGSILPGHGGILDRTDGILLAIPLGMFIILYN